MSKYIYITDPEELFAALKRCERIEFLMDGDGWIKWQGTLWNCKMQFRIAKPEPKLVPHWPAIGTNPQGQYFLTAILYASEEQAKSAYVPVVRLATEYPPIMLEVKE